MGRGEGKIAQEHMLTLFVGLLRASLYNYVGVGGTLAWE